MTSLLIFTKYPHPGKVKTRLAATVGQMLATEFYAQCAEHTFLQASNAREDMVSHICYSEAEDEESMRTWVANSNYQFPFILQSGNDLGERLHNATLQAFSIETTSSVLIIGTDTPDMSPAILRKAQKALLTNDIVIGPAADGGYYLIGMKTPTPSLFENITWSSPLVVMQTIQAAEKLNLNVHTLDLLIDIDIVQDLNLWLQLETTLQDHPLYAFAHQISSHE